MHLAETDGSAAPIADPRHMTSTQLRQLGFAVGCVSAMRYIRRPAAYAIHAADGTAMAVVEDLDVAFEVASENDMTLVAVH